MSREDALALIQTALSSVCPDYDGQITESSDLVGEDIIDSLDSMNLLFEIEDKFGRKFPALDEDYNNFIVGALIDVIAAA